MVQSLLLVFSLCLDTFLTSIAYGADDIYIPFASAIIINGVCTFFLTVSIFIGSSIKDVISPNVAPILSFILLFSLGLYRLFETLSKKYIRKISHSATPLTFKLFDFKFVLEIYADEKKADYDGSKVLTSKEALYLASALSLDSLAVGFGCSLGTINPFSVLLLSFLVGIFLLNFGCFLGRNFAKLININISWLAGVLLILLAFMRIT